MRHLFVGLVVAATTVLSPLGAMASNQEVAERIAANLRQGGALQDYKIGVKFQDGTAWLKGRVANQEQMQTALRQVFQTPGVTRVVNNLEIAPSAELAQPASTAANASLQTPGGALEPEQLGGKVAGLKAPRYQKASMVDRLQQVVDRALASKEKPVAQAQPLASSFTPTPARPVAATAPVEEPMRMPQHLQPSPRPQVRRAASQPVPVAYMQGGPQPMMQGNPGSPIPAYAAPVGGGAMPAQYDQPCMPNYAWPSYAAYPNYASVAYPKQYSPTAWPFIGPFYPYPQVPLGWRKVTLEWDDGWWMLDFKDTGCH